MPRGEFYQAASPPQMLENQGDGAPGGNDFVALLRVSDARAAQKACHNCRVSRGLLLIARNRKAHAALGPAPGELGLLADPGLILPPKFYGRSFGKTLADFFYAGGDVI